MVESLFKGTVKREEAMIVDEACILDCGGGDGGGDGSGDGDSSGSGSGPDDSGSWFRELLEAFEPLEFMLLVLFVVME